MELKIISSCLLLFLSSCFNTLHNKDAQHLSNPKTGFEYCNQKIGTKFIEGNCTKPYDHRLGNQRICSECPNVRFDLLADSTIYCIAIDSMKKSSFNNYLEYFKSKLGNPRVNEYSFDQSYNWTLYNEKVKVSLSIKQYNKKPNISRYKLSVYDLNWSEFNN